MKSKALFLTMSVICIFVFNSFSFSAPLSKSMEDENAKISGQNAGKSECAVSNLSYVVVVNSAGTKTDSNIILNRLQKLGYEEGFALPNNRGFYWIALKKFYSESEATQCLKDVRKKHSEYKNAWILCQKELVSNSFKDIMLSVNE